MSQQEKPTVRIGRGSVAVVALSVSIALVLGVATAAVAGTGLGATFNLGRGNRVDLTSRLVGTTDGPMLRISNKSTGANSTALELLVPTGQPPLKVISETKVANLNVEAVDGLDSTTLRTTLDDVYKLESATFSGTDLMDGTYTISQACLPDDILISGGPANVSATSTMIESFPTPGALNSWTARIDKNGIGDNWSVVILCISTVEA